MNNQSVKTELAKPMEVGSKKETSPRISKELSRGAWKAEEDRKLAEAIAVHGPKRWKTIAAKAGISDLLH